MISGSCLCGALRFEVRGNASGYWLCHCSKCRRSGGGPFTSTAICRLEAFHWLTGEDELTRYVSESGYTTAFCKRCGSPAPVVSEDEGYVVVSTGLLGPEYRGELRHHIFVDSKAPWWEIQDEAPRYSEHVVSEKPR